MIHLAPWSACCSLSKKIKHLSQHFHTLLFYFELVKLVSNMEKWQRVEAIKEFRVFTANSMFLPGRLSESRLAGADLKYKNTSRIQKTNHWQSKLCIWICRISSSSQQPQTKTSFCRFHFNAGKKGILGGGTWCYFLSLLTCRNLELLSELVVKLKVKTKDTTPKKKMQRQR